MNEASLLQNIAEIKLGWPLRKAIEDVGDKGNSYLVQTGDIDGEPISEASLAQVMSPESALSYEVLPGDILLRLRGPVFRASIFLEKFSKPVIATNQIAIIRVTDSSLDPFFLHWFLNSYSGQQYFSSQNEGTSIAKLNQKIVGQTPVSVPSFENQRDIGETWENWLRQRAVYQELISVGDELYDAICQRLHY
ncbi:restriction endonuclease subunit S [Marinobacter salarius]|uniref:restriction endonuclease subunit S n=1 Tax=Marinobacter salarius TaxID=1420917 RepID=UPI003D9C313A